MKLAGLDGCPAGWVAVVTVTGQLVDAKVQMVQDLAAFAVIDMPNGLVDGPDPRDVDLSMRARLKGKASSVFPTSARQALAEIVYFDASVVNAQVLGKKLPKQTFMLFPKLREVDRVVRAVGQDRLREGHPEVSFAEMAGDPVLSRKRQPDGQAERAALLERAGDPAGDLLAAPRPYGVAADDVLDAAAMLWTAWRFRRGAHVAYPPVPSRDGTGLEMSVIA
jgi:predicted RNase H-like nuclease